MERRYLVVPGIHSSRIHILDTKPDPRQPRIVKVIEPETIARRTGYAAPHTVHCGPDGIFMSALGAPDGNGPGGTFMLDPETFDVRGRWELDRGPQQLAYDIWWHLGLDTMITSTWGTPNMVKDGVNPELLLGGKYGSKLHVWDLRRRRHLQELDLGAEQQMVLELRPAHDPTRAYGFAGVVMSLKDLSSSIWLWYRDTGKKRATDRTVHGPSRRSSRSRQNRRTRRSCRRCCRDSRRWRRSSPTSICRLTIATCTSRAGAPESSSSTTSPIRSIRRRSAPSGSAASSVARRIRASPGKPLNGGPQMVEISRDGKRIYFTNSLYTPWDDQFYPDGIQGWMAKVDVRPAGGR